MSVLVIAEHDKRLTIPQIRSHKFFEGVEFDKLLHMNAPIVPRVGIFCGRNVGKMVKMLEKW